VKKYALLLILFFCLLPKPSDYSQKALAQAGNSDVNIGANNPLGIAGFSNGDTIYFNNGVFNRLGIGSGTQVLGVSGGIPAWVAQGGGTGLTSVGLQMDNVLYPTAVPNSPLVANGTLGPLALKTQAANTIFSNVTGSTAAPAFNAITVTAGTGLAGGGNITTNPTISLSTPVTTANGGTGVASAIANSVFCNNSGVSGAPAFVNLTLTAGTGLTGGGNISASPSIALSVPVSIANGGTNSTTANGAFNNLSPMSTSGDMIYENSTPVATRLAGNSTATKNFLTMTSSVPAWGTIGTGDLPASVITAANNFSPLFNTSIAASTLSFAAINQNANLVYAGPASGGAAAPTFRALVAADIPNTMVNGGRLYALTGAPYGDTTGSGSGSVFFGPALHNQITLPSGGSFAEITQIFSETSAVVTGLNSGWYYDVYIGSASSTTVSITTLAWSTSGTVPPTRATVDGRLVQNADHSKLFVGTIYISGSAPNNIFKTTGERDIDNYYNKDEELISSSYNGLNTTAGTTTTGGGGNIATSGTDKEMPIEIQAEAVCQNSVATGTTATLITGIENGATGVKSSATYQAFAINAVGSEMCFYTYIPNASLQMISGGVTAASGTGTLQTANLVAKAWL
jgi:hypothetical protein